MEVNNLLINKPLSLENINIYLILYSRADHFRVSLNTIENTSTAGIISFICFER